MRITVMTQARMGADPKRGLPDNYRTASQTAMRWIEPNSFYQNQPAQMVELVRALSWCKFVPTDALVGEWREFRCPDYDDTDHTTRTSNGAIANYEWEHRALVLEKDWQRLLAKVEQAKNPQPQVAKPNAREKFFNTSRIQVAHYITSHYNFRRADNYAVIVRDMLTHQVTATLNKAGELQLRVIVTEDSIPGREFTNKAAAIAAAKRIAAQSQLAFNELVDVVEWRDVFLGPEQTCVACGSKTDQRGYEQSICNDCKTFLEFGKRERAERVMVEVPLEGIFNSYGLPIYLAEDHTANTGDAAVRLLSEMLALAGVQYPDDEKAHWQEETKFTLIPRTATRSYNTNKMTRVLLSQQQYEHLAGAVEIIDALIGAAAAYSHKAGASLLLSLAEGDITADVFDDESAKRAKKMQR